VRLGPCALTKSKSRVFYQTTISDDIYGNASKHIQPSPEFKSELTNHFGDIGLNFHDFQAQKSSRYEPDFVTRTKGIYF